VHFVFSANPIANIVNTTANLTQTIIQTLTNSTQNVVQLVQGVISSVGEVLQNVSISSKSQYNRWIMTSILSSFKIIQFDDESHIFLIPEPSPNRLELRVRCHLVATPFPPLHEGPLCRLQSCRTERCSCLREGRGRSGSEMPSTGNYLKSNHIRKDSNI